MPRVLARFSAAAAFAAILFLTSTANAEVLPGKHVPDAVASGQARRIGDLPATQRLRFAIVLPSRNQAQLDQLMKDLQDPSSPKYHQYLNNEQFTAQFGPSQHDYDAVLAYAAAHNMHVTAQASNRRLVGLEASVADINAAFHVKMGQYQHPVEARMFFAPDREPTPDISVPVLQITGMNDYMKPVRHNVKGTPKDITGSGPGNQYLPSDIRSAYYGNGTLTGAGQTVAILSLDGYIASDVTLFFSTIGVTNNVPIQNVLVNNFSGACGSDGTACNDDEQILDIVQAIGVAPGISKLLFYESAVTDNALQLNQMATDNAAKTIGCSWGWDASYATSDQPIFQQMITQGQTFLNATGDYGAYNSNGSYSYPSDDPYVVQVGGTSLVTNGAGGAWQSETAWSGSGGGISQNGFGIPTWQNQAGVINTSNGGSTTLRNAPDISLEADTDNFACNNGACSGGHGGTSFAAPRWAGFLALANQQSATNGGQPVGFINPAVYNLALSSAYGDNFHDITSGSNPPTKGTGPTYNAVVGYDLVTGWGTPILSTFINSITNTASNATTTAVVVSPNPVDQGQNVTLTASVTSSVGTPAGSVAFSYNGTTLATVTLSNGSAAFTHSTSGLPSGAYTVNVAYTPSDSHTASSTTATVNISKGEGSTSSVTVTPNKVIPGASATITANVTGNAPTGSIQLSAGTLNIGSFTLQAINTTTSQINPVNVTVPSIPAGNYTVTATYSGDTNNAASTGTAAVSVSAADQVTLAATPNPTSSGSPVTLTATVSAQDYSGPAATGSVQFQYQGTTLATESVVNGIATHTANTGGIPAGNYTVTAVYSGDSNYPAVTSAPVTVTVQ